MFDKSAAFYDALYHWKDYAAECAKLHAFIQQHKRTSGDTLLDAACGTGGHIAHLRQYYAVEGLDLDDGLLAVAAERFPDITFHHGDMRTFDLGRQFDVLTCLFSSIGYVVTLEAMRQTITNFTGHVKPGGLVIVEPWFAPDDLQPNYVSFVAADQPDYKVVRMGYTQIEDTLSILNFHYLVGTSAGVSYFTERHDMGLFTSEEYLAAFEDAGLKVTHDLEGLEGRGLFIGLKPPE